MTPWDLSEVSCRAVSTMILYFETTYGRERLETSYSKMQNAPPLAYLYDPNNYISYDCTVRLIDFLTEESGDEQFPRKSGAFVATPKGIGFAYYMLRSLGTPMLVYERIVAMSSTINRKATFGFRKLGPQRVQITFTATVAEPNRHSCEVRQGQFAAIPGIWGGPDAEVIERACQVKGDAECCYEIHWQRQSRPVLRAIIGGTTGAALSAVALGHMYGGLEGGALGLIVGGAVSAALGYRRVAQERSELLRSQNVGLGQSLGEVQKRVEEIQELNQTLEKRVQDRTQELSLATTQLQAALERQMELDRLKTHFFQNISHELRTPLTLILAPLETLAAEPGHDNESKMQFEVMRRSALRLLGMINSLLDLSRLEAGKMRLQLADLDPAMLCRELVQSAGQLATQRGIKLTYDGAERLPLMPLDQEKFDKVVLNLLSNALKFTGAQPGRTAEVHLDATVADDRLVITVRDTGIGIPQTELQNIFMRFHQVDSSDERKFGGTGIGLALVKELVEFHMGAVQVQSKLGEGSTFQLVLPTRRDAYPEERLDRRRSAESVAVDRRKEQDRAKLAQLIANPADLALADLRPKSPDRVIGADTRVGKTRILLADDNLDMLSYLATILGREYEVITATDGDQAFTLATQYLPAVIVSDVMMPGKNGYALIKALKGIPTTRSIPIILVTAKADTYQRVAGIEQGADDYITKPFNFMELRARIKQLLKARSLERSLAERNDYLAKLNFDLMLSKKEVFVQTIESLAFALEAKDTYTHGHSRRVSLLSTQISREMGLSELEIERVRMSAVLHDIGKLGIPEHILRKEGRLTPEEEMIIRRHPEIGYRILESVKELSDVNRCILLHHEKFDGTGYPNGRTGLEIPLESRIIAVADTYDAMTSDRPYRKGLGHLRAIDELRSYAGTQFDPDCVRTFLRLYEGKPPVFPDFPSVFANMELGS